MRASAVTLAVAVVVLLQGAVQAQEGAVEVAVAKVKGVVSVQPWIDDDMPTPTRDKLEAAFQQAVARVRSVPECRALFTDLAADPIQTLATTLYFPADPYKETTRCRSALAYTYVGAAPTRLCRRFGFLSDEDAVTVILHEALHHAGLTERPSDPKAMSAGAINSMVRRACR